MKPGKFDEQPIPLMVTTLWFGICNSTSAFWTAASTPKSPHPGHQSGSTLPFKSAIATWLVAARAVAIFVLLNPDFIKPGFHVRAPRAWSCHLVVLSPLPRCDEA